MGAIASLSDHLAACPLALEVAPGQQVAFSVGGSKQFGSGTAILCGDNSNTHSCIFTSLSYS